MHRGWGSSIDRAGVGCYPGVELKARKGAMVTLDKIEVDLMAIRLGKLILVECKESGERLVEPNEAREFSGQLARLARLAEHLAASRLVVATSTTFPEDKEPLLVGLTEGWAQKVEWWDADRLLDPPRLIELRGGQDWPEIYLSRVSRLVHPSP